MMLSKTTPGGIVPFDCWLLCRTEVKAICKCEIIAFTNFEAFSSQNLENLQSVRLASIFF